MTSIQQGWMLGQQELDVKREDLALRQKQYELQREEFEFNAESRELAMVTSFASAGLSFAGLLLL